MIIPTDAEKIWQNPTFFNDKKNLNKLGVEGNFLNTIKGIGEKPTATNTYLPKNPQERCQS